MTAGSRRPRRIVAAGVVSALAALLATSAPASALASAADLAAGEQPPPRVLAVLGTGSRCVHSSVRSVSTESAAVRILQPGRVWALTRGEGVTVAVLDTGFDVSSSQLKGRLVLGPNEVTQGRSGTDCVGHGTFVAGLIAARPQTGTTVTGIAPQARVYGITVTDSSGATSPDVIAKGIQDAVRADIKIIDVSVVSPQSSPALAKAVATAQAHGAIVIAPAAADDQNSSGPVYPAALNGVVSVGNSVPAASATASSGGSGRGTVPVDLTAPGVAVLSVGPGGGDYIGTGAAYAAALVAGTAALMDAYHPGLSPAQRLKRLTGTAYPVANSAATPATYGMVDPYAAVTAVLPDEYGGGSVAPATQLVAPMPPARTPQALTSALIVAVGGVALLGLALCAVAVGRLGRARQWRPGKHPTKA